MKGITITQEIKNEFDERISFLKKRLNELEEEFNMVNTIPNNSYNTSQKLKMINPDWKYEKLIHLNELSLLEKILEDAFIVD